MKNRKYSDLYGSRCASLVALLCFIPAAVYATEPGCPGSTSRNPSILFCDDFDDGVAIADKWSAYDAKGGKFIPVDGIGVGGSTAMRAEYGAGATSAGRFSIGLGGLPAYYLPGGGGENWQYVVSPNSEFREIYWRQYLRLETGWSGIPRKFSRARVLTDPQPGDRAHPTAFQGHFWQQINTNQGGTIGALMFDFTRGVNESGEVVDEGNNSGTSTWLPKSRGSTVIFQDYPQGSEWICIEAHVRLNEPGMQNGIEEFWIDNQLDARRTDQNHIGIYTEYGFNQIVFDGYWNEASPHLNVLYRDNIVISTERIGCLEDGLPNAMVLNDGADWTIDQAHSDDTFVIARNAGCGENIDFCSNPGPPTKVYIEEGAITGAASVYDNSTLDISGGEIRGGLAAFAESAVVISGGSVLDPLKANDASTIKLTGGSVLSFLAASDDAMVMLSGGLIEQFISAAGDATIEIVGSNFSVDGNPVPYGNLAVSTGFLSGTLESGEVVLNSFYQGDALGYYSGTIRLVPEPDSSVVLIAGATLLAMLYQRRTRGLQLR